MKNSDDLLKEILADDPTYQPMQTNIRPLPGIEMLELECLQASNIKPKIQPWFWQGIVPLHSTTLFAGLAGIGKSALLLSIAAHASNGKPFAIGGINQQLPQGKIIIMSAEDDEEYQIIPKLIACNANLENIYLIKCLRAIVSGKRRFIDLSQQIDILKEKLKELKDVRLIIIDPVTYFLGNTKEHINAEVSNFINDLNMLAKEFNLAIILNKHLRKQASGSSITDAVSEVAGSAAWVNSPRQSWVICKDHENPEIGLFVNLKVNIAKKSNEAFMFKICPTEILDNDNNIIKTTIIDWLEDTKKITADEAVSKNAYEMTKEEAAREFILNYIEKYGQSLIKNIVELAKKHGFKERTLQRSYGKLLSEGVLKRETGFGGITLQFKT